MILDLKNKSINLINKWNLFSFKTVFIIFAALVIIVVRTGLPEMPNIGDQFEVSQNLTSVPFSNPDKQYLFTNYLQPLLFKIFGGSSLPSYVLYARLITFGFFILFILWFIKFHGRKIAVDDYKVLVPILFPVFMIPFYWVGMDGMTLLLMLLVMINFSSKWVIIPSALLAWQHFEQGFVSFLILLGTLIISLIFSHNKIKVEAIKKTAYILSGLLIGKALLVSLFYFLNIHIVGDRFSFVTRNLSDLIGEWESSWPYILFSLFGVCWFLIFMKMKTKWPLLVGGIFTFFFVILVRDQTRVGAIILLPALFFWVFRDKELWRTFSKKYIPFLILAYFLLPVIFVFQGFPYGHPSIYSIVVGLLK